MFSNEEKNKVLRYATDNSLHNISEEDEQKWQQLSLEMGRDWKEIRNAYRQWQNEEPMSTAIVKKEELQITDVISLQENYELVRDY